MESKDLISRKYIVRELLKEREQFPPMMAERYSFGVKLPHRFNQAMRGGIRKGLRIVETAPAVDAEPVRHGRWLPTNDDNKKRCSRCDVIHLIAQYPHGQANYCPNCGAKMDAEVEG